MTYRRAAAAGFALLAILMLATVRDYGVTWDEPDHRDYGRAILAYYRSGCATVPAMRDLNLYGGIFDASVALAEAALPWSPWTTRHVCTVLLGLLGVAGAWRVGTRLGGAAAGFWAGVLLAITPAWYGHAFNNPQDIPFAAGSIWSLALILDVVESLPAPAWPLLAGLGLVLGLTWGVRIGGVLLAVYLVAASAFRLGPGVMERAVAGRLAVVLGLAYAVMLAGWPAAQQDPLGWPVAALAEFTRFTRLNFGVVFGGKVLAATAIPWTYVPTYLGITLPEPVLLLLAGGGGWVIASFRRAPAATAGRVALVMAAAAVPTAFVILRGSVLFNGIRHLLFILPPLMVLSGVVLARGLAWLAGRGRTLRAVVLAVGVSWCGWHASRMIALHPYQCLSYNAVVGGLRGAFQRYDLDYWGECYPEALRIITRQVAPRTEPGKPPWRIAACGAPRVLQEEVPAGFTVAADPGAADFLVGLIGVGCGAPPGALLGYVAREGVSIGYAVDLRPAPRATGTAGRGRPAPAP